MARVIIPSPLRAYSDDQREVNIAGTNLKETMEGLVHKYPGFERMNNDFAPLSIFINSKLIRTGRGNWDTLPLKDDDEIAVIVPIAGG
jgi:molybdopterin converting factor small subunit